MCCIQQEKFGKIKHFYLDANLYQFHEAIGDTGQVKWWDPAEPRGKYDQLKEKKIGGEIANC